MTKCSLSHGGITCIAVFLLLPLASHGAKVHGRMTLGGYTATERFTDATGGSDKNDFMVLSSRLFLKVTELGDAQWETVADLRDKQDFFDKLNKEQLQLDSSNQLQVRQLSLRAPPKDGKWSGTLGRFSIPEAGAVQIDGGLGEYYWSKDLRTGVLMGKNSRRNDQTYNQYNPNSNQYGLTTTYQSATRGWDKNFYLSHAFVRQAEGVEIDRSYLFQNMIYQWEENSRLITLLYLDFVPRTYVQTGNVLWQQSFSKSLATQLNILGIDVIEYSRRQGVREILSPSPYREVSAKLDYFTSPLTKIQISTMGGVRDADHLSKNETALAFEQNQFFNRNMDAFAKLGLRKNFTSNDQFTHLYVGYFSRKWESGIDLDYSIEKYNDGIIKHATTTELSLSNYLSKDLFSTLSVQRAADETVTIWTGFFKIGYRFGNQESPPIRDGASPRGQL